MRTVILLLFCTLFVSAQGYKEFAKEMHYETRYETALQKAKQEKKNLMVLMITNYCPWCAKFEKKTLKDSKIDALIKSKYIPLILNKEEKRFPKYLDAPVVPTTYFIDPLKENSYYESVGFSNKIDFLHLLKQLK